MSLASDEPYQKCESSPVSSFKPPLCTGVGCGCRFRYKQNESCGCDFCGVMPSPEKQYKFEEKAARLLALGVPEVVFSDDK